MTFMTPRKLSHVAAKVLVENFILDNQIFLNLQCSKTTMKSLIYSNHLYSDELLQLKKSVNEIIVVMDTILKGCKEEAVLQCIRQELRTTDHFCCYGTLILSMLYDTEMHFRKKHCKFFWILLIMDRKYPSIQKLIFDIIDPNSTIILGKLIRFLPNLKIFKGAINKEGKCLTALRKNCPQITELTLFVNDGCFSCNQLTAFFFCGKSMEDVKKAFVKLQSIELTFPELKLFSINSIMYEQYDFFKMFLHFYVNVHFDPGLHHFHSNSVSWFDAVLSHTVVIHPDICLNQCDLNVYDLYLPFCERSLSSWKNLESLVLSLGIQGKKFPATSSTNIGKKFELLLTKLCKIKELCIRVQGPLSEDEVTEMVVPTLKAHGKKIQTLKIIGMMHYMSHRSLVLAINLCPVIKDLVLVGKRIAKYFKDVKVSILKNLESLTVLWSENQTNNACCQWISRLSIDLIKNSPKLKKLFITANAALLDSMAKTNFGSKLETLIIYFHTEKPCEGVDYIKKFLPNLPLLKLIVVKEIQCEESSSFDVSGHEDDSNSENEMEAAYSAIKKVVDKTEISIRYFSLEDSGAQVILL